MSSSPASTAVPSTVIVTESGPVRGLVEGGVARYLGIPFAAPPIGDHRFLAPQPPEPWTQVRDCGAYGATPQRRPFGDLTTIPEPSIPGDDTLSVNIFAPADADDTAALPVFVWVHGGGYFAGSPASPWYDGAAFARDGVITVTLSYRLGFDGFGWIEDAPLNRGILDQIAALEWVQRNIRSFGGDPERVTIAGQSAGGGSVLTLLASPRARGLFARVVSHSGAPGRVTAAEAEAIGRRFAADRGVEPTRAGWSGVSEDVVLDHQGAFNRSPGGLDPERDPDDILSAAAAYPMRVGLAFAPVIDGDVVVDVDAALGAGAADDVDLVMGTTRNEFAFPHPYGREAALGVLRDHGATEGSLDRFARELDLIGEAHAYSQIVVTTMFRIPSAHLAEQRAVAGAGGRTWLYDFAYHSAVDGLSSHCLDVPFAWDLLAADGVARVLGTPPQQLADRMHRDWVGFVTSGRMPWHPLSDGVAGAFVYDEDGGYDADAYTLERELIGHR
ncbi:MAG: carboxylesterase family protein [Microbacterium arborescens]